jgi:hypothetical protein
VDVSTDEEGMLFNCQNKVATPTCRCQLLSANADLCKAGSCTCAVGDPMPTQIGSCVDTIITAVGGRLENDTTFATGVTVAFQNGGFQITGQQDPAMMRSKPGDAVTTCLVSLPQDCPPNDTRGRFYKTTNKRTGESWAQPDAEHMCGGA